MSEEIVESFINILKTKFYEDNIKTDKYNPYYYNGVAVPRVTSILSKTINDPYIAQWANSLGFKQEGYRKTLNRFADIGTEVHKDISDHLQAIGEQTSPKFSHAESVRCRAAFLRWFVPLVNQNRVICLGSEKKLSCPWFGGTFDALLNINGKNYLIDFKTSSKIQYRYYLQLAAYRYLIQYNNILPDIDGAVILRLERKDTDEPYFEELVANLDSPDDKVFMDQCLQAFFSLVVAYYHLCDIEEKFIEFERGAM